MVIYILYVDVDNLSVEEIQQIQEKRFLKTPLLTLLMKYTKLISMDNKKIRGYGEKIYMADIITVKDIEKKIKGYGYDSLCLRYNIARDAQARYEMTNIYRDNPKRAMDIAERDKLRFYEILNDLIGEHD